MSAKKKGGGKPRPPGGAKAGAGAKAGGGTKAGGSGKPSRAQQIAALREAQQRRSRNRKILVGVAVGLTVVVIVAVIVNNRLAESRRIDRLEAAGCTYDKDSDGDAGQGSNHVASVTYEVDPPAGGNHLAAPARPGIYTVANVPPDGNLVHSLEHGDVILWHQVDVEASTREGLEEIARRYPDDAFVVPRLSLPTPVAATAWHDRLLCPSPEFESLDLFVRTFRDKGPETVPEG